MRGMVGAEGKEGVDYEEGFWITLGRNHPNGRAENSLLLLKRSVGAESGDFRSSSISVRRVASALPRAETKLSISKGTFLRRVENEMNTIWFFEIYNICVSPNFLSKQSMEADDECVT
jgi:hypothetical protein